METQDYDRIEQIEQMRAGVDYHWPVTIRDYTIQVRPLTISESITVSATVADLLQKVPPPQRNRITEHTLYAKETLKLATKPDPQSTQIVLTDYVLDNMTNDEIQYAFKQYVAACERVNPNLDFMHPDELDKLIETVKKSSEPVEHQVTELSIWELRSMALRFLTSDGSHTDS
jgi:hypothetical protein